MAKKHWIYIKRGLSEDPKHRAKMGECIWLYMHIIDRADWETGIAFDWKDKEEAADMSMPLDTLRRQRQKLEEMDYIRTIQKQHSQDLFIMEWRNPREYDSQVRNPRVRTDDHPENVQGLNQGSNEGLNQVEAQVKTPTFDSESKDSSSSLLTATDEKEIIAFFTDKFGFLSEYQAMTKTERGRLLILAARVGKETVKEIMEWAAKKEIHLSNRSGLLDSMETAAADWRKKVKYPKREEGLKFQEPKAFAAIREWERMTAENGNS